MNKLPMGWVWTELGQIADWSSGGTPSRKNPEYYNGDIAWIKTGDLGEKYINQTSEHITQEAIKNSSAKLFPKGSVALAMYGATIGKTSILGIDATTNQACAVALPNDYINNEFLYYLLLNEKDNFILKGQGGAQPNISQTVIKNHEIPLPPKAEQDHIATLLDNHLSQVATISQKLNDILPIIKQFRQSVLAQAVSGKLTEDWRESNKGFSAKDEFELILQEKKSHSKKIEKHLVNEEFDIPKEWVWSSLDALTLRIVDGTHHTPTYTESGIPFISVKDIKNGLIDFSNTKFISEEEHLELSKRCNVEIGDLLITKSGTIGRTAIVKDNDYFSLFVSVALIKPISKNININFIDFVLQKWVNEIDVSNRIVGSAIKNLHLRDMKVLAIPFPPLTEQQQIVAEVERLFAVADSIETQVKEALERVGHLTQSILHQAFTGNLSADWRACNADLITGEHSATALLAQLNAQKVVKKNKK